MGYGPILAICGLRGSNQFLRACPAVDSARHARWDEAERWNTLAEERARDGRSLRGSLSASICQKSGELHQWEASEGRYLPFAVGGSGQHGNIRPGQRRLLFESISPNPASSIRVDENHPISGMSPPLEMHSLTKGLPLRSGMPRLAAVCSRYRKQGRGICGSMPLVAADSRFG